MIAARDYHRHLRLGLCLLLASAFALLAWKLRFVQDDAFISFRYARNWVDGLGLVFNPGERVQGYTNFLWVLMSAVPIAFDAAIVPAIHYVSLAFFFVSVVIAFALYAQLFRSTLVAGCLVIMHFSNPSLLAYATGGLETALLNCLLELSLLLAVLVSRNPGDRTCAGLLSLSLSLLGLTRLDSALFIACILAFATLSVLQSGECRARKYSTLLAMYLPGVIVLSGYFAWCFWYYGDILPNTFHAKAASSTPGLMKQGFDYVWSFLYGYGYAAILLAGFVFIRTLYRDRFFFFVFIALLLWIAYVIKVGGDFMEYRFMVPAIPLFVLVFGRVVHSLARAQPRRQSLFAAVGCAMFVGLFLTHAPVLPEGVESIASLDLREQDIEKNWIGIGRQLRVAFSGAAYQPKIAVTAAGAIPYYSGLPCVDMHGLNDRWIGRHGPSHGNRPGHMKHATADYLAASGVDMLIGHPFSIPSPPPGPFPGRICRQIFDAGLDSIGPETDALFAASAVYGLHVGWNHELLFVVLPNAAIAAHIQDIPGIRLLQHGLPFCQ